MNTTEDQLKKIEIDEYNQLINQIKPKPSIVKHIIWAFVVGGLICAIAQVIQDYLMGTGLNQQDAGSATAAIMIFIAAFLTGIGVYDEIGQRAGAGSIVPITGFANAIVASAMEFKREGYIFGVGARIFTVAGPTLVFGFAVAMTIGLIKFLLG